MHFSTRYVIDIHNIKSVAEFDVVLIAGAQSAQKP
jgi:hypothetical protein